MFIYTYVCIIYEIGNAYTYLCLYLYIVDYLKITSPQQGVDAPYLQPQSQPPPLPQQHGQPLLAAISPPPFAPPFAPVIHPQYVAPSTVPPYGYLINNPYGSPSAPPGGSTYTTHNPGHPSHNYPMPVPFYGQQQSPPPPSTWSPRGQHQSLASAPPFPGHYGSPNQPPPPSYHQLFGQPRADQLPEHHTQNVVQPDVEVGAAKAPKEFKVGMKIEAVDRRFPYFVCAATIADMREKNHEVLIHFDGWTKAYDYWCGTDAIELHPVGWCESYGWELQKPKGIITYTHVYIRMYVNDIRTCVSC